MPTAAATPGPSAATTALPTNSKDAGAAHSGLDADAGDPNTRVHAGIHAGDNPIHTGVHAQGDLGDPDPGTVDSDFHPAPTECLGSSQPNRRCGEMTQTKFK